MFNTTRRLKCLVSLLVLNNFFSTGFANGWSYKNQDQWPLECEEGSKQSPIRLSRDTAQEAEFSSLIFEQYNDTYPVQSKNNGHSVSIRLHVQNQPTVKGGGLPHVYVLDNLHFHWDSEHTIDGHRFPLELHIVNYANVYPNISEALKHTGGVAVLGVLYYLSRDNDVQFDPLVSVIDRLRDKVNSIEELHIRLNDFLPRDRAGFYRYNGSLTTPPCTEGIVWTVFTNPLPISEDQLKAFPSIKTEDGNELSKNYRSVQDLNGRRVLMRSSPIWSGVNSNVITYASKKLVFFLLFMYFWFLI